MTINNRENVERDLVNAIMEAMTECRRYETTWYVNIWDGIAEIREMEGDAYPDDRTTHDVYLMYTMQPVYDDAVDFFAENFADLADACGLTPEELIRRTAEWREVDPDEIDEDSFHYECRDYIRDDPILLNKIEKEYHYYIFQTSDVEDTLRRTISDELDRIEGGEYDD